MQQRTKQVDCAARMTNFAGRNCLQTLKDENQFLYQLLMVYQLFLCVCVCTAC